MKENFKNADKVIIEISSLKNIMYVGGWYINIMKYNHKINTRPKLRKNIEMKKETKLILKNNLREIIKLCSGKNILFQTHMNFPKEDGTMNTPRVIIVEAVREIVEEYAESDNEIRYFDPTIIVNELGVANATLPGKLTEFSETMLKRVMEVHKNYFLE